MVNGYVPSIVISDVITQRSTLRMKHGKSLRLKKFDLNLLVIFECIYQHLSISKAAETLYITPSAVSQSLQRLRNQLNDPLFIRSGKGITPPPLGQICIIILSKTSISLSRPSTSCMAHRSKRILSSTARRFWQPTICSTPWSYWCESTIMK